MNEPAEVAAGLKKADHGLETAERALHAGSPVTDTAAYHCHQAAQKALKAFLASRLDPLTKTRDLFDLHPVRCRRCTLRRLGRPQRRNFRFRHRAELAIGRCRPDRQRHHPCAANSATPPPVRQLEHLMRVTNERVASFAGRLHPQASHQALTRTLPPKAAARSRQLDTTGHVLAALCGGIVSADEDPLSRD